jgi:hypothetical protein
MEERMKPLERKLLPDAYILLPIFALFIDLATPDLINLEILPAEVRWLSHVAVALMILLAVLQMLIRGRLPQLTWVVIIVSMIWSYVAVGHGQGIASTLWGVWLLFQFPLVALFAYLQPNLPRQLAVKIPKYAFLLLLLEVLVQLLQYATGTLPGDHLGGFFGNHGTGVALIFALMVNCILLGDWFVSKRWLGFAVALVLGLISGVLGEIKLFPFAITFTGLMAAIVYAVRFRAVGKALFMATMIAGIFIVFVNLYNMLVPGADKRPLQSYVLNSSNLDEYMHFSKTAYARDGSRYSDLGRMEAIEMGWDSLKKDPVTLLFGYGIGARSQSATWGMSGVTLASGAYGYSVGTSLLMLMQEMGVVGLSMFGFLILWIIVSMVRDINRFPQSPATALRYGLIFISFLWPIMLWYANVWPMRVPMLIYWYLVGFVLAESRQPTVAVTQRSMEFSSEGA